MSDVIGKGWQRLKANTNQICQRKESDKNNVEQIILALQYLRCQRYTRQKYIKLPCTSAACKLKNDRGV
jgi:hypothetical protein